MQDDLENVKFILGRLGEVVEVPESKHDAVTGLSGSGLAYMAAQMVAEKFDGDD